MKVKNWPWRLVGVLVVLGLLTVVAGLAVAVSPIKLLSPRPGATLHGNALIKVKVDAPEVTFVIFGIDGDRPQATNAKPYGFALDTTELADGPHTIFAEAYSRGGLIGRTETIRVLVKNGTVAPMEQVRKPATPPQARQLREKNPVVASALTSRALGRAPEKATVAPALSAEPRPAMSAVSLPTLEQAAAVSANAPVVSQPIMVQVDGAPAVMIDGKVAELDLAPTLHSGRLEAGFRRIMNLVGWKVDWLPERQVGFASGWGHKIELAAGQETMIVDGKVVALGAKVRLVNNRLVVAVRPVCQATGVNVAWDQKTRTAKLTSPAVPKPTVAEVSK